MNKKIRSASAILLAACSAATILTACGDNNSDTITTTNPQTTVSTEAIETTSEINTIAETTASVNSTSATVGIPSVSKTAPAATAKAPEKPVTTQKATTTTTTKAPSTEVIPEKSKGISLMTKTTPVATGNSAVIMVQGTPDKKYTIEFYESTDKTADYDGLETKTADSNGFVTWTFTIKDSCEKGNRKIIIKEKNSNNYLQTSIVIQ